jgi:hypothetical protein
MVRIAANVHISKRPDDVLTVADHIGYCRGRLHDGRLAFVPHSRWTAELNLWEQVTPRLTRFLHCRKPTAAALTMICPHAHGWGGWRPICEPLYQAAMTSHITCDWGCLVRPNEYTWADWHWGPRCT